MNCNQLRERYKNTCKPFDKIGVSHSWDNNECTRNDLDVNEYRAISKNYSDCSKERKAYHTAVLENKCPGSIRDPHSISHLRRIGYMEESASKCNEIVYSIEEKVADLNNEIYHLIEEYDPILFNEFEFSEQDSNLKLEETKQRVLTRIEEMKRENNKKRIDLYSLERKEQLEKERRKEYSEKKIKRREEYLDKKRESDLEQSKYNLELSQRELEKEKKEMEAEEEKKEMERKILVKANIAASLRIRNNKFATFRKDLKSIKDKFDKIPFYNNNIVKVANPRKVVHVILNLINTLKTDIQDWLVKDDFSFQQFFEPSYYYQTSDELHDPYEMQYYITERLSYLKKLIHKMEYGNKESSFCKYLTNILLVIGIGAVVSNCMGKKSKKKGKKSKKKGKKR
jgi:hypothetical protein